MAKKADYRSRIYDSYFSTHWRYFHSDDPREYELSAKVLKKRLGAILPKNKQARVIDVAFGGGHFLYFLQKEGYTNASGIDLSGEMVQFASRMGIKNVRRANFLQFLPRHKGKFDMIVANDVIEHLTKEEVMQFLDAIHAALVPGGRVLISTLNNQCLFGSRIRYIDFTHETGFTPISIAQIMRVTGFQGMRVFGEKPVAHDIRSAIRTALWDVVDKLFRCYMVIERGTGRGFKKYRDIFEPRLFAVGEKPLHGKKKR